MLNRKKVTSCSMFWTDWTLFSVTGLRSLNMQFISIPPNDLSGISCNFDTGYVSWIILISNYALKTVHLPSSSVFSFQNYLLSFNLPVSLKYPLQSQIGNKRFYSLVSLDWSHIMHIVKCNKKIILSLLFCFMNQEMCVL